MEDLLCVLLLNSTGRDKYFTNGPIENCCNVMLIWQVLIHGSVTEHFRNECNCFNLPIYQRCSLCGKPHYVTVDSPDMEVESDRHDITEIWLQVALSTIDQANKQTGLYATSYSQDITFVIPKEEYPFITFSFLFYLLFCCLFCFSVRITGQICLLYW